jgi:hypothetical protein
MSIEMIPTYETACMRESTLAKNGRRLGRNTRLVSQLARHAV